MLHSIQNSDTRHFALQNVSTDGMKGYLMPKMDICNSHRPVPVTLYADGVLRIGMINIDTAVILHDIKSCGITATAWEDGIVGVSMDLYGGGKENSARVYFEFDYNEPWQKPLYLVRNHGHAPIHWLKPFSKLSWSQRLAKLWPWAYPWVTV